MEKREYYKTIQIYFQEGKKEEQTKEAILAWSMDYLQLLLSGMHRQKTEPVEEATEQIGYVKRICERYLSSRDTYTNMAYLAGVMVGEARVGSAWIREQMTKDAYDRNMKILLTKAHVKDIIETIYRRQGIQHKDLAKQVGIKPNYLSQLITQLEEVQCVRSFRTGKCTYYELTIRGNEYVKENRIIKQTTATYRNFCIEFVEHKDDKYRRFDEKEKPINHFEIAAEWEEQKKECVVQVFPQIFSLRRTGYFRDKIEFPGSANYLKEKHDALSKKNNIFNYRKFYEPVEN